MENFLTWDVLLTYGGCVAGTIVFTEFLKKLFPRILAQVASFVIAILIFVFGHLAVGDFAAKEILLYVINAAAVSLAANGGFDILQKAFGKKESAPANDLIIDAADGEVYAQLEKAPSEYTDGQIVMFQVKKTPQK